MFTAGEKYNKIKLKATNFLLKFLIIIGIDLNDMTSLGQEISEADDIARKAKILSLLIKAYQDSLSSLEVCNKPVIAAVHSACVGAGIDMITAADIRYCTKDAWFQVKEVSVKIVNYLNVYCLECVKELFFINTCV